MFHRGARMLRTSAGTLRVGDWTLNQFDPEGLRSVANVLVWVHWFIVATCFVQLVYRPYYGAERFAVYTLLYLTLVAFTAYAHYRLASGRNITWRWVFALCSLDAALISGGAITGGGFGHYFFHLLYYPVLAGFAVFFTSFRLNMAFVTVVAVFYLPMSLLVGDGIDLGAREEKPLFAPDRGDVRGGGGGQRHLPVRADPVAGGGGAGTFARWKGSGRCDGSGPSFPRPFTTPRPSRPT